MKNVEPLQPRPFFRVPMQGAPPLRGWALQYISGIDDEYGIKPGYWLTTWTPSSTGTTFLFEPELVMCFNEETYATAVSKDLREGAEIETKVVRIG